nr:hypothetical protein [Myxococcota bacterium]
TPPRPPPPSCAEVADHVRRLVEPTRAGGDDRARRLRDVFLARCEQDRWEADVRSCITGTTSLQDPKRCKARLTPAQREALDREVAVADGPMLASTLPPACHEYVGHIQRLQTCQALPQPTREALQQALDSVTVAWSNVPPEGLVALEAACRSAADAVAQSVGATCGW